MSQTQSSTVHLRQLRQRMESARQSEAQQIIDRDAAIRSYGVAHPRAIAASRRLNHTRSVQRSASGAYTALASETARLSNRDRQAGNGTR